MDFVSNYPQLIDELDVGKRVMLADGTVGLVVEEKQPDRLRCRVILPGILRSRQGINLPGVKLSVPSMTQTDLEHTHWAAQQDVDFVGPVLCDRLGHRTIKRHFTSARFRRLGRRQDRET